MQSIDALSFESEEEAVDFVNDAFKTALDEAPWDFDNYGDEMVYIEERQYADSVERSRRDGGDVTKCAACLRASLAPLLYLLH
jgi:hypothetical protein